MAGYPNHGCREGIPGAYTQVAIALHLFAVVMLLVEWYGLGSRNDRECNGNSC